MKGFSALFAFCALLALAFWGAIIYIALHFVAKVW